MKITIVESCTDRPSRVEVFRVMIGRSRQPSRGRGELPVPPNNRSVDSQFLSLHSF